jgi:hypothetical protein
LDVYSSTTFTAGVSPTWGSIDRVNFSSANTSIATVSPANDSSSPYETTAACQYGGPVNINAVVDMVGRANACSDSSTLTCVPQCSFDLTNIPLLGTGSIDTGWVTYDPGDVVGGFIVSVLFEIADLLVADFTGNPLYPNPDSSEPFQLEVEAQSIGSTTYTATATMDDPAGTQCTQNSPGDITVTNPPAWWQVVGGGVVAGGVGTDVTSQIPATCDPAITSCEPYIVVDSGIPISGGGTTVNPGSGDPSEPGWVAEGSEYLGKTYNYSYFVGRLPANVDPDLLLVNLVSEADFTSGGTEYPAGSDYYYYSYDGSLGKLTISAIGGSLNSRKVILFVSGADVDIGGDIDFAVGTEFFMLISDGNIGISDSASLIEGVYAVDGDFNTDIDAASEPDAPLTIRGTVIANQILLNRELADNSQDPAETFEFAPDLMMQFPHSLGEQNIRWREVPAS